MYISWKYWKKHKSRALSILLSIIFCTSALTFITFLLRSVSAMEYDLNMDKNGNYDLVIPEISEDKLNYIYNNGNIEKIGLIYNGGYCRSENNVFNLVGAFEDENSEEIFHYSPQHNGSYPQTNGEIAGYKSTFEEMGCAAIVGNSIDLEISDIDANIIYKKKFIIVGVLNDQRSEYENVMRKVDSADYEFPKLFIYKDDLPESVSRTALIICKPNIKVGTLLKELKQNSINAYNNHRLSFIKSTVSITGDTEEELNSKLYLAAKDFYSTKIIPVFTCIIIIISFISIYAVVSNSLTERIRQIGIFRCIGLSRLNATIILSKEALAFSVIGIIIGFVLGICLYIISINIANGIFEIDVPLSFSVNKIVAASTTDPYIYPMLISIVCCVISFYCPIKKFEKINPIGSINSNNRFVKSSKLHLKDCNILFLKSLTGNTINKLTYFIIVFAIVLSSIFGCLFFMAKSDNDSILIKQKMNESGVYDSDYACIKNIKNAMVANVQFNRHNEGVTQQQLEIIKNNNNVSDVLGVIKVPSIKVMCSKEDIKSSTFDLLSPVNISNNIPDYLTQLNEKTLEKQGYNETDLLYNIPFTAVEDSFLEEFDDFLIEGTIDLKKVQSGEEIIIAIYDKVDATVPFNVGDEIQFTDVVITDDSIEKYDFSANIMPEGVEPSFYYSYSDDDTEKHPGYAFGNKVIFNSKIGCIIHIDDNKYKTLLHSESNVINKDKTGYVDLGFDFVCSTNALKEWKLPDSNYTNVMVKLKSNADIVEFEKIWYQVIGKSIGVTSISKASMNQRIKANSLKNSIIYYSLVSVIVIQGMFGIVNLSQLTVKRNLKNISIMRSLGVSKRKLCMFFANISIILPTVSGLLSIIPIQIFDIIKNYAYTYAFSDNHNFYSERADGKLEICWQALFPWYIELWKQPVFFVIIIAVIFTILISLISNLVSIKWISKQSITDAIRNDTF